MRRIRTSTVLALVLASIVPGAQAAAHQPTTTGAVRISGNVHPDRMIIRFDPNVPWLVLRQDGPAGGLTVGYLQPLMDPRMPWLVNGSTSDIQRWRGARFDGRLELDDPRFADRLSMLWNTDVHTQAGASVAVHTVTVRVGSADGGWTGTLSGSGDPATGSFRIGGSLDGSGAFAGGTALIDIHTVEEAWEVEGLVVAGDMPPLAAFAD